MTIKELENRTGMGRANIRFYENEGLLSPKRLDNGYRDYSEEDVRTLEKIKLLRQLQLDLETIRTVQKGTLTLEQALFAQLTKLEGDRAVIERAAEVCRALEKSGVEYAALDPEPYLQQLTAPSAQPVLPPPPSKEKPRDDTPRACYHPWQRWLARMLDMSLYSAVFDALWLFLLRDRTIPLATGVMGWVLGLILLAFTLAVEPFWLHYWGWTPGKRVFGLKLRDKDGNRLTIQQAARRGFAVAWEGYGLNIPIYGWWRMWQGRKLGLEGRDCPWDGEEDYRYTKEERRYSGVVFAAVSVLCIASTLLGVRYTQTPPNQGGLTVEQFAENYNYYANQLSGQVYAEYIQPGAAYGYNEEPLEVTRHAWLDMNGDGQEELLLRVGEPKRADDAVSRMRYTVVLSEQEGTVYAYFFGFFDETDAFCDDGTVLNFGEIQKLSFWKDQCYQYTARRDASAQPVKWVDGAPAG